MFLAFAMTNANAATQADKVAVGAASAQFPNIVAMAVGETYLLSTDCNLCFQQGANPTAVDAATCGYLHAGQQLLIKGDFGVKLAVIGHASATGFAFLTKVQL